jgi:hypothetical protein
VTGPLGVALLIIGCVVAGVWLPVWLPSVLLALAGLTLLVLRVDAVGGIVVGTLLAGLSATLGAAASATAARGDVASYDLREGAIPDDASGEVELVGHLRTDWMLDEYRVQRGQRPDSARESEVVLAPLLGTTEDLVTHTGRVVVARLDRSRAGEPGSAVVTIRGELVPIADELLATLFATHAAETSEDSPIRGVMLDTLAPPAAMRAIGNALTSAVLGLIGIAVFAVVLGGDRPSGQTPPKAAAEPSEQPADRHKGRKRSKAKHKESRR